MLDKPEYWAKVYPNNFRTVCYGPDGKLPERTIAFLNRLKTAKIDIPLTVGAATISVDVDAGMQPILNTESPTLGETFTENTINSIPLNGRDFTQLTVYTPGAVSPGFGSVVGIPM